MSNHILTVGITLETSFTGNEFLFQSFHHCFGGLFFAGDLKHMFSVYANNNTTRISNLFSMKSHKEVVPKERTFNLELILKAKTQTVVVCAAEIYGHISGHFYKYLTRNHDYWRRRGVDGPTPVIGVGTTLSQLFGNKVKFERKLMRKYGEICGLFSGNVPYLMVTSPTLIKDILVNDFDSFNVRTSHNLTARKGRTVFHAQGDQWRRLRAILRTAFTAKRLKRMCPKVDKCCHQLSETLKEHTNVDTGIDLRAFIDRFATHVTAYCLLNTDNETFNDELNPILTYMIKNGMDTLQVAHAILPRWLYSKLTLICEYRMSRRVVAMFERNISEHKSCPGRESNDVIDVMLKAYERQSDDFEELDIKRNFITDDEMVPQLRLFTAASFEMIANNVLAAIYELTLNEDIQQRLYEELCGCHAPKGHIDYEILSALPYLDAIVSETVRMHNPHYTIPRAATGDYTLRGTGVFIPKGQRVEIPILAYNLCEKNYPKGVSFIPERFLAENRQNMTPNVNITLGLGPRNCFVIHYGLLVIKMCLSRLVMRYRFYRTVRTDIPLKLVHDTVSYSALNVFVGIDERLE